MLLLRDRAPKTLSRKASTGGACECLCDIFPTAREKSRSTVVELRGIERIENKVSIRVSEEDTTYVWVSSLLTDSDGDES